MRIPSAFPRPGSPGSEGENLITDGGVVFLSGEVRLGPAGSGTGALAAATAPLTNSAPLAAASMLGSEAELGGAAAVQAEALTQGAPLTQGAALVSNNSAGFRTQAGAATVFVEAIDPDTAALLARVQPDSSGRYQLAVVPTGVRAVVVQATALYAGSITGYLAATIPLARRTTARLARDISGASTLLAFDRALLAGVRSEFDVRRGFRGLKSSGFARLCELADPGIERVFEPSFDGRIVGTPDDAVALARTGASGLAAHTVKKVVGKPSADALNAVHPAAVSEFAATFAPVAGTSPGPEPSPSPSSGASPSPTPAASPTPSASPEPTASPGPAASASPTASPVPSASPAPGGSPTPAPTPIALDFPVPTCASLQGVAAFPAETAGSTMSAQFTTLFPSSLDPSAFSAHYLTAALTSGVNGFSATAIEVGPLSGGSRRFRVLTINGLSSGTVAANYAMVPQIKTATGYQPYLPGAPASTAAGHLFLSQVTCSATGSASLLSNAIGGTVTVGLSGKTMSFQVRNIKLGDPLTDPATVGPLVSTMTADGQKMGATGL
jgi:hypothetical protein